MSHRRPHDDVGVEVTALEPRDHLGHQARDRLRVRALELERPVAGGDADRPGAPEAGVLVALEVAGVEMD